MFLILISSNLILACSCLAAINSSVPSSTGPAFSSTSAMNMNFPYQAGWLGADSAYSIPLGGGRDLWLFGDTFVGNRSAATRRHRTGMPRNSVGIARCKSGHCSMRYYWAGMYTPTPRSFFDTGTADWYWPMDGFVWKGKLYLALMQMHAQGSGAFGFAFSGVALVTIPNYTAPPNQWHVSYQTVLNGATAIPGPSIVVEQGDDGNPYPADPDGAAYAYFFTYVATGSSTRYTALTRLPLASLARAAQSGGRWQYLSSSGWTPWTTPAVLPANAVHVMDAGPTELTVRYHPAPRGKSGTWLAVMPSTVYFDKRGVYSISTSLNGPWPAPATLYVYPEMQNSNPNYTPNVFCYADKEHPELESPGSLTFTYACNSIVEDEVLKNMNLYHPRMVTMAQPVASASKKGKLLKKGSR
jgi:hypothetical protein